MITSDTARPFARSRPHRKLPLVLTAASLLLVCALVATGWQVTAPQATGWLERTGARLWISTALGLNPRAQVDGWTIILPRGDRPWLDEWGRPAQPSASYQELGNQIAAAGGDILMRLPALTGVDPTGVAESAGCPPVIVYDSIAALGPWGKNSAGASGVYFAGIIAVHAAAAANATGNSGAPADQLQATLAHEFAHWYLDVVTSGAMPRWLSEGIAMRAEERYVGAKVPTELLRERAFRSGPAPLDEVMAMLDRSPGDLASEFKACQLARSFVAYLDAADSSLRPGWESRLVAALCQGNTLDQAFREACGLELSILEARWLSWLL